MKNIYISAIYTSPPNSMWGNTKIILEFINNLFLDYTFIIFTTEPETFKKNIKNFDNIKIIEVPYPFNKFSYFSHLKEVNHVYDFYKNYFDLNWISKDDYFYSSGDFGPDILPIYRLKKQYDFIWIASLYLFISNPIENLLKNYKFPFLKYIIYYFYQRYIFDKILKKFDLCLITNHCDIKFFPINRQKNVLPVYWGVNIEQIESVTEFFNWSTKYDAIFCSRLHQQKGISQLLDICKLVVDDYKDFKFGIIGNWDKDFEIFLKEKSKKLNIENNIEWLGYVNNEDKYKLYLSSKIFLHGTIFDNNWMVAAEALCSWIPVVMYDLENLRFYSEWCVKVKIGDKNQFSKEILKLINDKSYYNQIKPSIDTINKLKNLWNWKNRSNLFHNFLKNNEKI